MREAIAKNEYYEMEVDKKKNRSYSKYMGYWQSVDAVPNYLEDIKATIQWLNPGFTTLIDMREFKIPHPEVMNLMLEAQALGDNAGFSKSAIVVLAPLEKLATKRIVKEGNVKEKSREFNSVEEAEAWLDV